MRKIILLISTAIIAGLIYFGDISKIITAFQSSQKELLALAVIAGTLQMFLWSLIWRRMLEKTGAQLSISHSFRLLLSGHFLNSITPLGQFGGEPVMAKLVSNETGQDYEKTLAAIFSADMIYNMPPIFFLVGGLVYTQSLGRTTERIGQGLEIGIPLLVVGLLTTYIIWFRNESLEKLVMSITKKILPLIGQESYIEFVRKKIQSITSVFTAIGETPLHLLGSAFIAHIAFFCEIICMYLILLSLGQDPAFGALYLILPLSAIAEISPTPGGLGTYEAAMTSLLIVLVGLNTSIAVTATILYRLATYWQGLLLGYTALNFRSILAQVKQLSS